MSRFKNWQPPAFDKSGYAYKSMKSSRFFADYDIHPDEICYGWKCQYNENLKLGENVDISSFVYINAHYGVEIGDNVQIGPHSSILSDNTENETKGKVVIGENSLIGSYTLILPNSVIPPNSKIKARSIIQGNGNKTFIWSIPNCGASGYSNAVVPLWNKLK